MEMQACLYIAAVLLLLLLYDELEPYMLQSGNCIALFSAPEQTHSTLFIWDSEWMTVVFFYSTFLNIHWSGVLTVLFGCHMAGATWNCCCFGTCSVYTIQQYTSLQSHFIWRHICMVHVCLAVTCHLHFWQNDQDLLSVTAVTQG